MVLRGVGLANGTIILDEPNAVYYAGQLMSGNVHFELKEPLTLSAININYLGEASVVWIEGQNEMSGGTRRYREIEYTGREQYFNIVQCVYGGTGVSTLPAEIHSIPFQFEVPLNVPSSFESDRGKVTYRITVYMELLEPVRREKLEQEFKVVAPLVLQTLENVLQPLELDFEEIETCNCFCQSKPISLKVLLPSYVINTGSNIPIVVKAENDSSVEICEISFKITNQFTFRTTQPRSEYTAPEEELVEIKEGPILGNTKREYTWDMRLPDVMLPNLDNCSLMDVAYNFKVKIKMTGCNDDIEDESDIFIGLVPTSDPAELAQSGIAQYLPKAAIPNPNNPPAFAPLTSGLTDLTNRSPNVSIRGSNENFAYAQIPQQFAPPGNVNNLLPVANPPYEIGFKSPDISPYPTYSPGEMRSSPVLPQYPVSGTRSSDYPNPAPMVGIPYPTGQTMAGDRLNSSQIELSIIPSAPPL